MNTTNRLVITKSEAATLRELSSTTIFETNFNFLNAHNGFREEKVHLFIGSTGAGKSTLVRSLVLDFLKNNPSKNLLLILSEESIEDVKGEFSRTQFLDMDNPNLMIISEEESKEEGFLNYIDEVIRENNIHCLFYDNLTTSFIYNDKRPNEQFKVAKKIKTITKKNEIATVLIAHTNAEVNDNCNRLITENDIRGTKSLVNLVEFLYILQRFEINQHFFPTVRIKKHRSQDPESKMFRLIYNSKCSLYQEDLSIGFKDFKAAYGKRDKL